MELYWGQSFLLFQESLSPVQRFQWSTPSVKMNLEIFMLAQSQSIFLAPCSGQSTRNILRRKSMHLPSFNCVLCPENLEETRKHRFLHCSFAKAFWSKVGIQIDDFVGPIQNLENFRAQLHIPFFMEVISLWAVSGAWISSKESLAYFCGAQRKKYFPLIESWREQLV